MLWVKDTRIMYTHTHTHTTMYIEKEINEVHNPQHNGPDICACASLHCTSVTD